MIVKLFLVFISVVYTVSSGTKSAEYPRFVIYPVNFSEMLMLFDKSTLANFHRPKLLLMISLNFSELYKSSYSLRYVRWIDFIIVIYWNEHFTFILIIHGYVLLIMQLYQHIYLHITYDIIMIWCDIYKDEYATDAGTLSEERKILYNIITTHFSLWIMMLINWTEIKFVKCCDK